MNNPPIGAPKVVVVLGMMQDPKSPSGKYAAFRCGNCPSIHLSVISHVHLEAGQPPLMQLALTSPEAKELAAALVELAEAN